MKKILMIAFHYPPYHGGSGVHRTLKFSRYLPDHGWLPIVLSANPRAYPHVGNDQLQEIPPAVPVIRAFALDAARHLSLGGFYPRWMAVPDRWVSWWMGGVLAGLRAIHRYRPQVIWSTFPLATAHLIGLTLHRLTRIPWVTDFRDSMTEDSYPSDPLIRRSYCWIERQAAQYSSCLVFTTPSARLMYLNRYPWLSPDRCQIIPNGYDEDDFTGLTYSEGKETIDHRPLRLLHTGVIYPEERDPSSFFRALARLKKEGLVSDKIVTIDLRAPGSEGYYAQMMHELEIDDMVFLHPSVSQHHALQDGARADGLLLFQAASCNHQIPAKAYEYLRLQKPILALTADDGDTAQLLRTTGGATIIDLADERAIYNSLPHFLDAVRAGTHPLPDKNQIGRYSRKQQTRELVNCVSHLSGMRSE